MHCNREKTIEKDGFSLCAAHAADRVVAWRSRSATPQQEEARKPMGRHEDAQEPRPHREERPAAAAGTRKGSPAKEAADAAWLVHVRDLLADAASSWDASYSFPARFVGPANDSTDDDPRTDVEAVGLGLRFSIPNGALPAPRPELLDEFISSQPPAIC